MQIMYMALPGRLLLLTVNAAPSSCSIPAPDWPARDDGRCLATGFPLLVIAGARLVSTA